MRAWTWVTVVGMCLAGWQAMAQEPGERKAEGKLSLRLTDEVISKAVRETLAEQPAGPRLRSDKALSGDAYKKFERAFSEAEKPGCLNPDALKFQPSSTVIGGHGGGGWNVGVTGLLALPFWATAVVRGKCK